MRERIYEEYRPVTIPLYFLPISGNREKSIEIPRIVSTLGFSKIIRYSVPMEITIITSDTVFKAKIGNNIEPEM